MNVILFVDLETKASIYAKVIQNGSNYVCADCGFETAYKNSCVNHIEAKHVENIYFCQMCQKHFNSKAALSMHNHRYHRKTH